MRYITRDKTDRKPPVAPPSTTYKFYTSLRIWKGHLHGSSGFPEPCAAALIVIAASLTYVRVHTPTFVGLRGGLALRHDHCQRVETGERLADELVTPDMGRHPPPPFGRETSSASSAVEGSGG